jgi:hypothetical protein
MGGSEREKDRSTELNLVEMNHAINFQAINSDNLGVDTEGSQKNTRLTITAPIC